MADRLLTQAFEAWKKVEEKLILKHFHQGEVLKKEDRTRMNIEDITLYVI